MLPSLEQDKATIKAQVAGGRGRGRERWCGRELRQGRREDKEGRGSWIAGHMVWQGRGLPKGVCRFSAAGRKKLTSFYLSVQSKSIGWALCASGFFFCFFVFFECVCVHTHGLPRPLWGPAFRPRSLTCRSVLQFAMPPTAPVAPSFRHRQLSIATKFQSDLNVRRAFREQKFLENTDRNRSGQGWLLAKPRGEIGEWGALILVNGLWRLGLNNYVEPNELVYSTYSCGQKELDASQKGLFIWPTVSKRIYGYVYIYIVYTQKSIFALEP